MAGIGKKSPCEKEETYRTGATTWHVLCWSWIGAKLLDATIRGSKIHMPAKYLAVEARTGGHRDGRWTVASHLVLAHATNALVHASIDMTITDTDS